MTVNRDLYNGFVDVGLFATLMPDGMTTLDAYGYECGDLSEDAKRCVLSALNFSALRNIAVDDLYGFGWDLWFASSRGWSFAEKREVYGRCARKFDRLAYELPRIEFYDDDGCIGVRH